MRFYLLYRYVLETVDILEERNLPHPRCTQCNKLVPCKALNGRHPATYQCARGDERKRRRLEEAELRESLERAFKVYGEPLEDLNAFRYLVWVLMSVHDDWLAVVGNLGKSRKSLGRLSQILSQERLDPKVFGHFYKAVL